ncbi:MAG: M14 family zinc carboxypeptidase [Candidatus Fermentibacteraceae bacterium]
MTRWIATLILLAGAAASSTMYSLAHMEPAGQRGADLLMEVSPEIVHVYGDGSVDFVATSEELSRITRLGLPVTVRVDDLGALNRAVCARSGKTMGGFMTWDEIQDWMDDLHASYPGITSAPTSIGDTYQGRPQLVMKISTDNNFDNDDPSMANAWYDGLIHAREGASMRNVRSFMEWLCANYGEEGYCGLQATWLLENREIWCLPCNNVDGWVYNEDQQPGGGGMHRKNMNWSAGGDGIDLNRNWAVGWGGLGSSGNPSDQTYRGTAPLSEPETDNVDMFWQDHPPAQMHSTHTYGNILIYPWGYQDDPPTDIEDYETQAEMMVQWGTGEMWGQSSQLLYYSSGNTRDHAYGLYDAMSWNHETGADFEGFWPSAENVVKLTRRNLRSFLVTACLAGCPDDPHEPGIPELDPIGSVGSAFTVSWSSVPEADSYALQELEGYSVLLDDTGDSGPFTLDGWDMTSSQYHSPSQCYVSSSAGSMTWTETVTVPEGGGGRISFWACYDIPNGSSLGAFEYSPDGGENWYYLQTFTRNDMTWRRSIHELDEWEGETLSFRWTSSSSSCDFYVDDIKVEVWDSNSFVSTEVPGNSYYFSSHPQGNYWFRAVAMDSDFGPGWPSEPEEAIVGTATSGEAQAQAGGRTALGHVSPNPASGSIRLPVTVSPADAGLCRVGVYDLSGRRVADLGAPAAGPTTLHWECASSDGPLADGVYFVRMDAPGGSTTRRFVISR